MPSSAVYNAKLAAAAQRRAKGTARLVGRMGRRIDRWTADLEARLLGIVAAGRGGVDGVIGSTDVVLIGALVDGERLIEAGLREIWHWAWNRVTHDWIAAVPLGYWIRRLAPIKMLMATECEVPGDDQRALVLRPYGIYAVRPEAIDHLALADSLGLAAKRWDEASGTWHVSFRRAEIERLLEYSLADKADWEKILTGQASRAEAIEIVRKAEFGAPRPERVDYILDATNAPDGMSAMQRIKTVAQKDLGALRSAIRGAMSGEFAGASAVEILRKRIKPILSAEEGLNYKARRIARTEGIRVAAAAQQESERAVVDMLKGQLVSTSRDAKVRDSHAARWDPPKLYLRTGAGYNFMAADGEPWPGKEPYGPNCRCTSVPVLHDELYAPLPDKLPATPQTVGAIA